MGMGLYKQNKILLGHYAVQRATYQCVINFEKNPQGGKIQSKV